MRTNFFIWSIVVLVICCNPEKKAEDKPDNNQLTLNLNKLFRKVTGNTPENVKYILIIPLENSCNSCMQKGLEFSRKVINNREFRIVLSSSSDAVINSAKISHFNGSEVNALVTEQTNLSFSLGLTTVFPVLLYLENDAVINHVELNAENIDQVLNRTLEDLSMN